MVFMLCFKEPNNFLQIKKKKKRVNVCKEKLKTKNTCLDIYVQEKIVITPIQIKA